MRAAGSSEACAHACDLARMSHQRLRQTVSVGVSAYSLPSLPEPSVRMSDVRWRRVDVSLLNSDRRYRRSCEHKSPQAPPASCSLARERSVTFPLTNADKSQQHGGTCSLALQSGRTSSSFNSLFLVFAQTTWKRRSRGHHRLPRPAVRGRRRSTVARTERGRKQSSYSQNYIMSHRARATTAHRTV